MFKEEDLQVLVIENMFQHWNDVDVRQLYGDIMSNKINGYGKVYGENIISSDKADFFGTHIIVAKKGIRLKPIFSYKSVTTESCDKFLFKLPCLDLIKSDASIECLAELENILKRAKDNGNRISYDYSWSQDASLIFSKSKEDKKFLQDLMFAIVPAHHLTYGIDEMIACGALKVKTDRFFDLLGMREIISDSTFNQKSLNNSPAKIFHCKGFSEYALECFKRFENLWNNRIEVGVELEARQNFRVA